MTPSHTKVILITFVTVESAKKFNISVTSKRQKQLYQAKVIAQNVSATSKRLYHEPEAREVYPCA